MCRQHYPVDNACTCILSVVSRDRVAKLNASPVFTPLGMNSNQAMSTIDMCRGQYCDKYCQQVGPTSSYIKTIVA